ncbi:MAG: RsmF rRNA methyltransferase first C-terminal domain-containing protein [Lachnospiraceae bacterium]|nr:RsmF rRNA methyltransferase first C-terminal domain-containing protein [Lachnospiraceae bacterium]
MDTQIHLPAQFTDRMRAQLPDGFDAFMKSYEDPAQKAVRFSTLRIRPDQIPSFAGYVTGSSAPEKVSWCENAYYYEDTEPGKSPLHDAGAYYMQEPSAMFPVSLLDVDDSGMKVLDLCAAPGGKSTQIADLMKGRGLLVANEIIPSRAAVLSENLERMGVTNALAVNSDPNELAQRFPAFFDRILVDAPCSGEGMFRKNPEAVSEWSIDNVNMCAERQQMLLACASSMLSPGGKIVYSTCTFSPEEDDETIGKFLDAHPEYMLCGNVHIYPHTHRGEGHFAAAIMRACDMTDSVNTAEAPVSSLSMNTETSARKQSRTSQIMKSPIKSVNDALLSSFLDETFSKDSYIRNVIESSPWRLLPFGDSLYLVPEHMPGDLTGLKIKRAGLKLGTFKKNRFEPDHALSHAVSCEDVKSYIDLDPDGDAIRNYLSGGTLTDTSGMKGWCLIGTRGIPAGWGKAASGTVKNHYPAGLRKTQA